ncbi:MAG: hypothetical protein U9N33_06145 [Campylobacterota bacterium]|nr:hypothetical protein [Campylobacterota bacterium]
MFKNVKSLFIALVAVATMFGCQGPPRPGGEPAVAEVNADAKTIYISSKASFADGVAPNIKKECTIDAQVMKFIKAYAANHNINVIVDGKPKPSDTVLKVSIVEAISAGNAGVGHNKYITISGELYDGKTLQSSFKASRRSGGGYFGVYRGSCSVLGSCAKTLGKDTAGWLTSPVDNAKLGDIYLIK